MSAGVDFTGLTDPQINFKTRKTKGFESGSFSQ